MSYLRIFTLETKFPSLGYIQKTYNGLKGGIPQHGKMWKGSLYLIPDNGVSEWVVTTTVCTQKRLDHRFA